MCNARHVYVTYVEIPNCASSKIKHFVICSNNFSVPLYESYYESLYIYIIYFQCFIVIIIAYSTGNYSRIAEPGSIIARKLIFRSTTLYFKLHIGSEIISISS